MQNLTRWSSTDRTYSFII